MSSVLSPSVATQAASWFAAAVQEAIATVKFSRQSHQSWLEYYDRHPDKEAEYGPTCGDRQHHLQCVQGYDNVLMVLDSIRPA